MKDKLAAVALFLCLAGSLVATLRSRPADLFLRFDLASRTQQACEIAFVLALPILLLACVRAFFHLRFAHGLGLLAALLALPWLVWTEWRWAWWGSNAWIFLNVPDALNDGILRFAVWKILATAIVLLTLGYCMFRVLPERWMWRGTPLCRRTWPAFTAMLVLMALWYASSISPYRIPVIADSFYPEYSILHVERHGLQFRETRVSVWRDGRFSVTRTQRRLFQYRFPQVSSFEVLPNESRDALLAFGQSPDLRNLQGAKPMSLRNWRDEGWYVAGPRAGPVGFGKSLGTPPPQGVIEAFRRIEALPVAATRTNDGKDVCLGFCYDPLAGLGIVYVNQRCRTGSDGRTRCR